MTNAHFPKKIGVFLLIPTLFTLLIISSRFSFFPWYIEDNWGFLGLFISIPCFMGLVIYLSQKLSQPYVKKLLLPLSLINLGICFSHILLPSSFLISVISLILLTLSALCLLFFSLTTKNTGSSSLPS